MRKILMLFLPVLLAMTAARCRTIQLNQDQVYRQGIEGLVIWSEEPIVPIEGEDVERANEGRRTAAMEIHIHELTHIDQVNHLGKLFFSDIRTEKVRVVNSDLHGFFSAGLPPGMYSIFVKQGNVFFANNFDSLRNISPVKVVSGEFTQIAIEVNYMEAF
jgi:hypothetical protein